MAVNTGKYTGRSSQDRSPVKNNYISDKGLWGKINKPISSENFNELYNRLTEYLSGKEILDPINTWTEKGVYIQKTIQLVHSFHLDFGKFTIEANQQIMVGGPLIDEHHHPEDHI